MNPSYILYTLNVLRKNHANYFSVLIAEKQS